MITLPEYDSYDAMGLAELVRRGEVQPIELVEAAIERIEQRNPRLNAVIHVMYDEARAVAAAQSEQLPAAPFAGIPFLLKDLLVAYAGSPLRSGSRYFADYVPTEDVELVRRYKAAGLITLGKTNTPEFGMTGVTEPELFGPTNNPWDVTRTAGGSSGGSAAAVAARMVPLAHGTDGLGSIRIPASCCGLFGLKPSRGRTPASLDFEVWQGFVCDHVLTRSVRDSAAMLDATAGPAPGALTVLPRPERPFLQEVGADPGRLRIGFTAVPFLGEVVDPAVRKALMDTVALLQDLGHELIEATPTIDREATAMAILTMAAGELRADLDAAERLLKRRPRRDQFDRITWPFYLFGNYFSAAEFVTAIRRLQQTGSELNRFFDAYDLFLTPVTALPPVKTGSVLPHGAEATALKVLNLLGSPRLFEAVNMLENAAAASFQFTPYTPPTNVTGRPAMSVPLAWTDDNLPLGMQFIGPPAGEALLLRLAGQLEQARPWKERRPPAL